MGIFNEFYKKEKPVFTGLKFGFGSSGGPTGPTGPTGVASGAFVAWGGGGGGGEEGSLGGGGGANVSTLTLTEGSYTFIVGSAGCGYDSPSIGFGHAPAKVGNGGGGGGYSGIFAGDLTPFDFRGTEDPSSDRDTIHAAAIMMAGGGGASGQEPSSSVGGGGGGGTSGYGADTPGPPNAIPGPSSPGPGKGGGGTQSAGGAGGAGDINTGASGDKLYGGNTGSGAGGSGYYGGGAGGLQSGNGVECGGGGSGYINPSYGSATMTNGSPGSLNGTAALPTSPYYPGTAGQGGRYRSNTSPPSTAGCFVIGTFSGALISVTPPGGSPSPVPTSGQAFNTAGKYLLVVS